MGCRVSGGGAGGGSVGGSGVGIKALRDDGDDSGRY